MANVRMRIINYIASYIRMIEDVNGDLVATRDAALPTVAIYVWMLLPWILIRQFWCAIVIVLAVVGGKVLSHYGYGWSSLIPLIRFWLGRGRKICYSPSRLARRQLGLTGAAIYIDNRLDKQ